MAKSNQITGVPITTIHYDCYRPQTKLHKGNVFTPICHSVHGGGEGVSAPVHVGIHTPLWADNPLGRFSPQHTATAADGAHPLECILVKKFGYNEHCI